MDGQEARQAEAFSPLPSYSRVAFTLLEVILALTLSALLLAGIYAAVEQSWRMTASGREEMERAQLARALIHKFELDIRSITFIPPPPDEDENATSSSSTSGASSGGSSGGSSAGGSSKSTSSGASLSTSSGNASAVKSTSGSNNSGGSGAITSSPSKSSGTGSTGTSAGTSGGAQPTNNSGSSGQGNSGSSGQGNNGSNTVSGSSNSSSSNAGNGGSGSNGAGSSGSATSSTDTEATTPNSVSIGIRGSMTHLEMHIARPRRDLQFGTSPNGTISASRTSDLRAVNYTFVVAGSGAAAGLVRTEGDRMAVETAESSGHSALQASHGQVLAPEVIAARFRFLDMGTWHETWDSETSGHLPRAVEITIGFAPPRRKPSMFDVAVSRSMDTFRTVVLIPISDPVPPDSLP